jgi:rubredoxin
MEHPGFADLPDEYICPLCEAPKSEYKKVDMTELTKGN